MFRLFSLLILLFGFASAPWAAADESGVRRDSSDREKWESLSEEERTKLREALREVWTDPAVLSAREEVKLASEAYQEAIRTAVAKADPSVAGLLKEMQKGNEGRMNARVKGDGPAGRFGPRPFESPAGPPAFLENLTPDERAQFREAEEKAQQAESVIAARKEMEKLREQDEQIRRRRMEAHLKMRRAVLEAMFAENPELRKLQSKLGFTPGKGKGRPGGKQESEKPDPAAE